MRRRWVELLWGAFALASVTVIVTVAEWETIPFHLIWASLTLLYGFRVWSPRVTAVLLAVVSLVTGSALAWAVVQAGDSFDEVAEVPLMAAMFVAMVWHARRRQAAVEEARRMAEGEHQLLERQRDFVRDASHELRTPITVARGHAELLRASCRDPQTIRDADVVLDELGRLSRLSERLLLLAAAEHADFLTARPVDIAPFVEETLRRWSPTAPRDWRLEVEAEGVIVADPDRLRDAIDALVENALQATTEGQAIALAVRARGSDLLLEVADRGAGIDPERLPTLFERFSRVDAPRSRRAGGTGLGLSIVKAIAEAHGGSVEVESRAGEGSRFAIVISGFRRRPSQAPASAPASLGSYS